MKKLVLTGAAGRLGSYLREPLSQMCDRLVSTDWTDELKLQACQLHQIFDAGNKQLHNGCIHQYTK